MGTRPVRVISGWTVGGGGKLAELFPLPPWLVLGGRWAGWWIRHPAHAAVALTWVAASVYWRSLLGGTVAAVLAGALIIGGWVAWTVRRGSAYGLRAILSGMSRQRQVRRLWDDACGAAGVTAKSDAGRVPPLRDMRITPSGVTAVAITGAVGRNSRELVKASDQLAAASFCDRVLVRPQSPSAALVRWDWGQHLASTYRLPDLPPATSPTRIVYGIREDGGPAELVFNLSTLVVGASGSGKSSLVWAYLAGLIRSGIPFRVRVLDPGRVEFEALRVAVEDPTVPMAHQYVRDLTTLNGKDGLWANLDRALEARLAAVERSGNREHVPTLAEPLDVTIIDELLPISDDLRRKGVSHPVGKVAYIGRKAGFVVIGSTQAGKIRAIGDVRDLFPQRVCMRTMNWQMTVAALGDGAHEEARCQDLDVDHDRGVGYSAADGRPGFEAFRAAWVPDAETKMIARGQLPNSDPASRADLDAAESSVYRLYGDYRATPSGPVLSTDALLYVGLAVNVDRRLAQHAKSKWWWPDVQRHEVETYPNRELAETAEAMAIRSELPAHNDLHNRANPDRSHPSRWWKSGPVIEHDHEEAV